MTGGIRGWLGLSRQGADAAGGIAEFLLQKGVSPETLEVAAEHQLSLRTRLISTLVERGELEESEALDALCRFRGLPGLSLRRSIIELSNHGLPESLARDHQVLPVQMHPEGAVILACSDPPEASRLREYELALGRRVLPHLALELYLCRTIHAFYRIRSECDDAAYLVGDDVDVDDLPQPQDLLFSVTPATEIPDYQGVQTKVLHGRRSMLLGMAPGEGRDRISDKFSERDVRVLLADDGASALRQIASDSPALIVLDAMLPGRSGMEIMVLLGTGQLYRTCTKVLLLPRATIYNREALSFVDRLTIVDENDFDGEFEGLIDEVGTTSDFEHEFIEHLGQSALFRGSLLHQDGDLAGATSAFQEALNLDPLLAAAHREVARVHHALGRNQEAAQAFSLSIDLGGGRPQDVAQLAEIVQQQGNLRLAERLWHEAALLFEDPEIASLLSDHANALRRAPSNLPS